MVQKLAKEEAQGRGIRAGRALLGWDQSDLATQAGVAPATIANVEQGRACRSTTRTAILSALTAAGVSLVASKRTGVLSVQTGLR